MKGFPCRIYMKQKVKDVNIYNIYMKDIRKYGTIDDAKTREYLKMYKECSLEERKIAKERIVGALQMYVHSVANKFSSSNNLLDIINEGNIGLMTAIEKYDMESDVKFTTYAMYWIKRAIIRYITIDEPMVTPRNAIKLATYVPKIRREFWNENNRYPTTEEIQEILNNKYKLNFSNKADLIAFQSMSIDEKYGEDDDGQEFMETNEYTSKTATCNTDKLTNRSDKKITINQILSHLSERDTYIVKCIYGIDCHARTMDDVAADTGISYERVRQIAVNSVENLGKTYKHLKDTY